MNGKNLFGNDRKRGLVAPSILSADFARLGEQVEKVEEAGAELLHLDVMDGHFVDNITFGPPLVKSVRRSTHLFLDCHLMIEEPLRYAKAFVDAGADLITIHAEVFGDLLEPMRRIRSLGVRSGVSLNPDTPLDRVEAALDECDLLLLMSVFPGFGGQIFCPEVLEKIETASKIRNDRGLEFAIQIDGGVDAANAEMLTRLGGDILVAGSAVFSNDDPAGAFRSIEAAAAQGIR